MDSNLMIDGEHNFSNLSLPHWHNITFLVNINRDIPTELGVILFGYVLPFLLALTLATNLLIVVVLSQAHMRTSTNLVLLAMAISDLLTILSPAPWYFYLFTLGHHQNAIYPPRNCYLFHCMHEVLPALFHTYSIWLTLLLAGQRYIYVCHFSLARTWCTVPRVVRAIVFILIMAIVHQASRFCDRIFLTVRFFRNDKVIEGCEFLTAAWVDRYIGENVYYMFYYGFRIVFVHIGPCVCLVLLNVLLFRALHRTKQTRERLFAPIHESGYLHTSKTSLPCSNSLMSNHNEQQQDRQLNGVGVGGFGSQQQSRPSTGGSSSDSSHRILTLPIGNQDHTFTLEYVQPSRVNSIATSTAVAMTTTAATTMTTTATSVTATRRDSNSITFMLIVIVSVFLSLEIPLTLTTILHVLQSTFQIIWIDYNTLNTTTFVTNFFIILSHPINFAIYCGMSRQFRQTFSKLFIHGLLRIRRRSKRDQTLLKEEQRAGMNLPQGMGTGIDGGRTTTNLITGASSSTFGVTSKSCTFSVTIVDHSTNNQQANMNVNDQQKEKDTNGQSSSSFAIISPPQQQTTVNNDCILETEL